MKALSWASLLPAVWLWYSLAPGVYGEDDKLVDKAEKARRVTQQRAALGTYLGYINAGELYKFDQDALKQQIAANLEGYRDDSPSRLDTDLLTEVNKRISAKLKEVAHDIDRQGTNKLHEWLLEQVFLDGKVQQGVRGPESDTIAKRLAERKQEIQQIYRQARDAVAEGQIAPVREALAAKPASYFPTESEIERAASNSVELQRRIDHVSASLMLKLNASSMLQESKNKIQELAAMVVNSGVAQYKEQLELLQLPLKAHTVAGLQDELRARLEHSVSVESGDFKPGTTKMYGVFNSIAEQIPQVALRTFTERVFNATQEMVANFGDGESQNLAQLLMTDVTANACAEKEFSLRNALDNPGYSSQAIAWGSRELAKRIAVAAKPPVDDKTRAELAHDVEAVVSSQDDSRRNLKTHLNSEMKKVVTQIRAEIAETRAKGRRDPAWKPDDRLLSECKSKSMLTQKWLSQQEALWAKEPPNDSESLLIQEAWDIWQEDVWSLVDLGHTAQRLQSDLVEDSKPEMIRRVASQAIPVRSDDATGPPQKDLAGWIADITEMIHELWQQEKQKNNTAASLYPNLFDSTHTQIRGATVEAMALAGKKVLVDQVRREIEQRVAGIKGDKDFPQATEMSGEFGDRASDLSKENPNATHFGEIEDELRSEIGAIVRELLQMRLQQLVQVKQSEVVENAFAAVLSTCIEKQVRDFDGCYGIYRSAVLIDWQKTGPAFMTERIPNLLEVTDKLIRGRVTEILDQITSTPVPPNAVVVGGGGGTEVNDGSYTNDPSAKKKVLPEPPGVTPEKVSFELPVWLNSLLFPIALATLLACILLAWFARRRILDLLRAIWARRDSVGRFRRSAYADWIDWQAARNLLMLLGSDWAQRRERLELLERIVRCYGEDTNRALEDVIAARQHSVPQRT